MVGLSLTGIYGDAWGVELTSHGLFVVLRYPTPEREGRGFVIKPRREMNFRERHDGYRWAREFGPLYLRTYARKPVRI